MSATLHLPKTPSPLGMVRRHKGESPFRHQSYQLSELRGLGGRRTLPDAAPARDRPDEVRVLRLHRVMGVVDGTDVPRAPPGALPARGGRRAAAHADFLGQARRRRRGRNGGAHARFPGVKEREGSLMWALQGYNLTRVGQPRNRKPDLARMMTLGGKSSPRQCNLSPQRQSSF